MAPDYAWGSRLGCPSETGYSPHVAPTNFAERPSNWFGYGEQAILMDGEENVYMQSNPWLRKYDGRTGIELWRKLIMGRHGLENVKREPDVPGDIEGIGAAPALLNGSLYFCSTNGIAVALSMETGAVNWTRQVAAFCNPDGCQVGVARDMVVFPGREAPWSEFDPNNNRLFAISASSGERLWVYQVQISVITCIPVVLADAVLFQSQPAIVECLHLKDGTVKWQQRGDMSSPGTSGGVGVSEKLGMAFAASNRKGRRSWNFPFGGNGVLRAFKLADGSPAWEQPFDLEANTVPTVAPVGPKGSFLVLLGLGANPGPIEPESQRRGDQWWSRVAAVDAKTGEPVWTFVLPMLTQFGPQYPNNLSMRCTPTSNIVCGSDGSIYFTTMLGLALCLDGATGARKQLLYWRLLSSTPPVIGPGMLILNVHSAMQPMACCWRLKGGLAPGQVIRPLVRPLDETGTDHFWPVKQGSVPSQPCIGQTCAPTDLTEPSWTFLFNDPELYRWYKRGIHDFTHKTPIIDSQGNIYIATHCGPIWIIRPDGKLRGFLRLGYSTANPALHKRCLFVAEGNGWCHSVDVETLKLNWSTKYAHNGTPDSWNVTVCEPPGKPYGLVLVVGDGDPPTVLSALRTDTGVREWRYALGAATYNFLPSVWNDEDGFIFCDSAGGIYCLRISTGAEVWVNQNLPAKVSRKTGQLKGCFSTGACVGAPNGLVYHAYNQANESTVGRPLGGIGVVRAWVRDTGEVRWEKEYDGLEANNAPMLVEKLDGTILVVPLGSNADNSPEQAPYRWVGRIVGLDGETGEEIWGWDPPVWEWPGAKGPRVDRDMEFYNPDSWSNPPVMGADGTMYCQWHDGTIYAFNPITGEVKSKWTLPDCGESGIPVIGPGLLACPGGMGLRVFRDLALEAAWREEARENGDPRAFELVDVEPTGDGFAPASDDCWGKTQMFGEITDEMFNYWTSESEASFHRKVKELEEERQAKIAAKAKAKAEAKAKAGGEPAKPAKPTWVVVGGKTSGGIMAKEGKDLKSPELGRVSTGAVLEQSALEGERLLFRKLLGDGPSTGWVSLTFKGSPLVEKQVA